uniref:Uncharacterized protein n=1 Tax=Arundo donax TaxID=35708 RepID=A0A0A9AXK9_ARUDO
MKKYPVISITQNLPAHCTQTE